MTNTTKNKPAPYNFDVKLHTITHTIEVDTSAGHGWWQNDKSGTEGGLTFKGMTLTDYDGTYCLPMRIISALRAAGFVVSEDFE
jgi:hypothetical protein